MNFIVKFSFLTFFLTISGAGLYMTFDQYFHGTQTQNRFPASVAKMTILNTPKKSPKVSKRTPANQTLASGFFDTMEEHYEKFDNYGNGTHMCHHFLLENKQAGMRDFMIQLSNFVNKRCIPQSLTLNGPYSPFESKEAAFFLACCDKVDSIHAIPHFRFEKGIELTQENSQHMRNLHEQRNLKLDQLDERLSSLLQEVQQLKAALETP